MQIAFAHQNFPAQFGDFGRYLGDRGHKVLFLTAQSAATPPGATYMMHGAPSREPAKALHRFARPFEKAAINGHGIANAAIRAKRKGVEPDVIVAHTGWGSGTFLKAVWPEARFVPYLEWYYNTPAPDTLEPPDPEKIEDLRAVALARNVPILADLAQADLAFCPTQFQARQFPARFHPSIAVLHDGVDAEGYVPDPEARMVIGDLDLSAAPEIVTYATRGMEPHRGFPEFMRALALLQRSRPGLHAVIGGEDRICYGAKLPEGESWKTRMLAELELDLSRVHFVGLQPRGFYRRILQASHAHVYLTLPFVLSWSLIEAMAVGTPLVASDVEPVQEVIAHGEHGLLVDHANIEALAASIAATLDDRTAARARGEAARALVLERYDRRRVYPEREALLAQLIETG